MNPSFCIFSVDDDAMLQATLRAVLEREFELETFASSEACLARLEVRRPDLLLLDISLPGIDGYEFCRRLKGEAATQALPVCFVSSHDSIDDRLAGYEAGGADFIVKPFAVDELLRKVRVAQRAAVERCGLIEQAQASEQLTSMVLESMDEFGLVLQLLGKVIACTGAGEVATAMQHLLKGYRLDGVVQVRVGDSAVTLGPDGPSSPLETSIVNHVRTLGRLFEFRQRSVHNFEHITVMVANMPLANADFCGRIRDNLNMAAQGAEARLQAMQTEEANRRRQVGIARVLDGVRAMIGTLTQNHQRERQHGATLSFEIQQDLIKSFVHLGLTTGQERFLEEMIKGHMERLVALYDSGAQTQGVLEKLGGELELLTAN